MIREILTIALCAVGLSACETAAPKLAQPPPPVTNSMGPITGNSGIITQGQTGSNTIYERPPQDPMKFYALDGNYVGDILGPVTSQDTQSVTFQAIGYLDEFPWGDLVELQGRYLKCSNANPGFRTRAQVQGPPYNKIGPVTCEIVR